VTLFYVCYHFVTIFRENGIFQFTGSLPIL